MSDILDPAAFHQLVDHIQQFRATIPPQIRVIAVTKTISVAGMRAAYQAGIRDFGESRLQDALPKQAQIADLSDIVWHFIGHLQSNKAQKVLQNFQWIHSVDSLSLAQRLDRLAQPCPQAPQICLQVKLRPDDHKSGWRVPDLWADLPQLSQLHHLKIRGLMVIPPLGLQSAELLDLFQTAHNLAQQIQQQQLPGLLMDQLSMGMSDDYAIALKAGATMIRPGRLLFAVPSLGFPRNTE